MQEERLTNPALLHQESQDQNEYSIRPKFLKDYQGQEAVTEQMSIFIQAAKARHEAIDHVLIFSGNLGSYGGHANLDLLHTVRYLKNHKPGLEIGWDGGINSQNVAQLVFGGVDVLNVGAFIQNAENPEKAYLALDRIASETGSI